MIAIDDERFDKIIVWLEMLRAKLQQDGLSSYESTVDDIICELEISEVDSHGDFVKEMNREGKGGIKE